MASPTCWTCAACSAPSFDRAYCHNCLEAILATLRVAYPGEVITEKDGVAWLMKGHALGALSSGARRWRGALLIPALVCHDCDERYPIMTGLFDDQGHYRCFKCKNPSGLLSNYIQQQSAQLCRGPTTPTKPGTEEEPREQESEEKEAPWAPRAPRLPARVLSVEGARRLTFTSPLGGRMKAGPARMKIIRATRK